MDPHEQDRQAISRAEALMRIHLAELGYNPDSDGYSIPENAIREAAEYAKTQVPDALTKSIAAEFAERVIAEIRLGKQRQNAMEMSL